MTHPSESPPSVYACLKCIAERKLAEAGGRPVEDLPPVQIAATLAPMPMPGIGFVVVPHCYEHIEVAKASPLLGANGGGLPPGLRRPPAPGR
jgi:hypothetical protein